MFNWGIMGAGSISSQFAKAIDSLDDAKIYAVASASGKNPYNIKSDVFYSSYDELVSDSNVDAIYVGTIHPCHLNCVRTCLKAGKPVLCEKPIAMNSRELEEMISLAKENNTFFMEAMWSRYLPGIRHIKDMLDKKKYGKLHYMNITFGNFAKADIKRLFEASLGGGALLDLGVYGINITDFWMGREPDEIKSWAETKEDNVDLTTNIQFIYKDGPVVDMMFSINRNLPNNAYIVTDKAEFRIPYFWRPTAMMQYEPNGAFNNDLFVKKIDLPLESNGYQYEALEVMRCVKEGLLESPDMTWETSLRIMNQIDDIRKNCGIIYPQDNQ